MADNNFQRLEKLKAWRDQELARQAANRFQMALDEDFYDGLQWDPLEAAEVMKRGQNPIVYNQVKPTVDWLLGAERKARIDFKVAPTQKGEQAMDDATAKTKLMKFIGEESKLPFRRSQAFSDAVKAGVGWREIGVRSDPDDEPIYIRNESWRNIIYDSLSRDPDYVDARYLFRLRVVDLDVAQAYFPKHKKRLEQAAEGTNHHVGLEWWFGRRLTDIDAEYDTVPARFQHYDAAAWIYNARPRVNLYEAWYFEPTVVTTKLGAGTFDRVKMSLRVAVFCDDFLLVDSDSPYKHGKIPFAPTWCYRRARDGAPYGVIRNLRGPQEALNKRHSKAIWAQSVNQVIMERDAVDEDVMDVEEIREEASAPDGLIVLAPGGMGKFQQRGNGDIAQANINMAQMDHQAIREIGGVTSENLGRDTNLVSGVALQAKQQQGAQVTAEIFDNNWLADQMVGEMALSLSEQYYTEAKTFRLTGERGAHDFVDINTVDETTGQVINPIASFKAQFVIDKQDYRASMRQAMFESLFDILGKVASVNPNFAANVLDLVVEYSDVPGKDTIVKRIRELNGQRDPDTTMTPEEEQAKAAEKEVASLMQRLEVDRAQAEVDATKAKAKQLDAQAVGRLVTALYESLQAGQIVATVPGVAPVADEIAMGAGFKDQGGSDPNIPGAQIQPAAMAAGPVPDPLQSDGARTGIETPAADGIVGGFA